LLSYRLLCRPLLRPVIAAHTGEAGVYVLATPRAVRRFAEPGVGGGFRPGEVVSRQRLWLVERFGSRDDAAIVEFADLQGRQSEDLS